MTHFEFTAICLQHLVTPMLVWELEETKELIKKDKLNKETLTKIIMNNFIRSVKSFLFRRKMELKYKKPYKEILCVEIRDEDWDEFNNLIN